MKTIVYQIGRLDGGMFKEYSFEIDGITLKTDLSSFAIKHHLEQQGNIVKLFLLYPVSLPFQPSLLQNQIFKRSCPDTYFNALSEINEHPEEYLSAPVNFFSKHPHSDRADSFIVLHSLGTYKTSQGQITFQGKYTDIVLEILISMMEEYLANDGLDRVIVDISSGHNIYVSALLEAVRYFSVWNKLYNLNSNTVDIEIAISEPVIPGIDTIHRIYLEKLDVKAMFSSPVKYKDIENYALSKRIYSAKELRKNKTSLQELLESFLIVFSSIFNNAPLYIYHCGYHDTKIINENLKELLKHIHKQLSVNYTVSPLLDRAAYLKAILSLGMYAGIVKILYKLGVHKISENGVEIISLRCVFKEIYKQFNLPLNDTILGNEIDRIKGKVQRNTNWITLIKVMNYGDDKVTKPQKRNFFAHAGLEGNITQIKAVNNEADIYLRYKEQYLNLIKSWLKEGIS